MADNKSLNARTIAQIREQAKVQTRAAEADRLSAIAKHTSRANKTTARA